MFQVKKVIKNGELKCGREILSFPLHCEIYSRNSFQKTWPFACDLKSEHQHASYQQPWLPADEPGFSFIISELHTPHVLIFAKWAQTAVVLSSEEVHRSINICRSATHITQHIWNNHYHTDSDRVPILVLVLPQAAAHMALTHIQLHIWSWFCQSCCQCGTNTHPTSHFGAGSATNCCPCGTICKTSSQMSENQKKPNFSGFK